MTSVDRKPFRHVWLTWATRINFTKEDVFETEWEYPGLFGFVMQRPQETKAQVACSSAFETIVIRISCYHVPNDFVYKSGLKLESYLHLRASK